MALVHINGFEDATGLIAGSGNPIDSSGRNGSCLGIGGVLSGSGNWQYNFPAPNSTFTVGFAFRQETQPAAMGSSNYIMLVYATDLVTDQIRLCMGASGQVAIYRSASQITGAISATGVIPAAAWCYVELQLFCNDTTGTAVVRVNGTTVINVSGVDTKASGSDANCAALVFMPNANNTNSITRIDDLYLMTGTGDSFLGDCVVDTLYPNGNGNANQWVGSDSDSVNNYLLVNETGTPVTTTYTGSPTSGQQDMYTLTDLTHTGAVLGVEHHAFAAASDAGAKSFKIVNRRAADTKSASLTLASTYADFSYILATDPETSAAWTNANVNALQGGVEVV